MRADTSIRAPDTADRQPDELIGTYGDAQGGLAMGSAQSGRTDEACCSAELAVSTAQGISAEPVSSPAADLEEAAHFNRWAATRPAAGHFLRRIK